jgi:effector-binding domain-containing protein
METKFIEPKKVVAGSFETTLNKMNAEVNPFIENLMTALEQAGLKPSGPMEFIYKGASSDMDKTFLLEIAQPVSGDADPKNLSGFKLKETPAFTCVQHRYKGKMDGIMNAYDQLFANISKESLAPTDEVREVYQNWVSLSSDQNIVDIQVGIQPVHEPAR